MSSSSSGPSVDLDAYRRVLAAEPRLRPIAHLVDALCTLVRADDTMCAGCVWESIVEPLTTRLVGWSRGYPPQQATDDRAEPGSVRYVDMDAVLNRLSRREPPASETEAWLRGSDAYDAFTDEMLRRLEAADPASGHGIRRGGDREALRGGSGR
jgi:hypothetical protein